MAILVLAAIVTGCSRSEAPASEVDRGSPSSTQELPPGHPPLPAAEPAPSLPPVPSGAGSGAAGLSWTVPDGWAAEEPSSAMRRAQYRIAGPGGDAECVVFYFGPGQGGGAEANALRWADQFDQPDGSSSREALRTRQIEVAGLRVLLAEISGTYGGGMTMGGAPPENLADHMLLGAIAEGPDANWFFKLTGPRETVEPQREGFEEMIRSLRPGSGA